MLILMANLYLLMAINCIYGRSMKISKHLQKRSIIVASILVLIASFTSQKVWADRHDQGHRSDYYDRHRYFSGYQYDKLYRPSQFYYNDYPPYYYPYYYDHRSIYIHPFPSLYSFFISPYYPYSYNNYPNDETFGYYSSKRILSIIVDGKKLQLNAPNGRNGRYSLHLEKGSHKIKWTVQWANGDIETYSRKFKIGTEGRGSKIFIDGEHFYQE